MTTQKRIVALLLLSPLILPVTLAFGLTLFMISDITSSIVNIHYGYSLSLAPQDIEQLTKDTIKVIEPPTLAIAKAPVEEWIFNKDLLYVASDDTTFSEDHRTGRAGMARGLKGRESEPERERQLSQGVGRVSEEYVVSSLGSNSVQSNNRLVAGTAAVKPSEENVVSSRASNGVQSNNHPVAVIAKADDDDPFLAQWKKSNEPSQPKDRPDPPDMKRGQASKNNPGITTLLNDMDPEGSYTNYASVEGEIKTTNLDEDQNVVEVAFYDQLGSDGLESKESTILASQELRDGQTQFSLRLPVETQGYLVAKLFSGQDPEKENPLYIGTYSKNPMMIPKDGLKSLSLQMISRTKYVDKYQTLFIGKLTDEYLQSPVSDAVIWVAETNHHVFSDENGAFEVRGLLLNQEYHLIFEKEGMASFQVPIRLVTKKMEQAFIFSPEYKFQKGYDVFLGGRDSNKATIFATIRKQGKPLERAIIKAPQSQKVVYERILDLVSFPDPSLYSSSENGNVILWNTKPGKNKIDVFYDGELLGSKIVKLSPGVIHKVTWDF